MTKGHEVEVEAIEVLEDFSATARCDEGFLQLRRLRCHNRRVDGSVSKVYRVDVVDRPTLDAVAVLIHRRGEGGQVEVLTRRCLRPAAYFRADKKLPVADLERHLRVEEIVAGVLEQEDVGEEGIRQRAAAEVHEEAGFRVSAQDVRLLGAPFFVAPGILSEQIYLTEVDVTGKVQEPPEGDGSPLEEGAKLSWRPLEGVLEVCREGAIRDAKTELAVFRFLART